MCNKVYIVFQRHIVVRKMDDSIFKAYDIRGTYPEQINEKVAVGIGKAFGTSVGKGRVFLARDFRESSVKLSEVMRDSIVDTGISVSEIGIVPTPVLYFAIAHMKYDGGVMVSASFLSVTSFLSSASDSKVGSDALSGMAFGVSFITSSSIA